MIVWLYMQVVSEDGNRVKRGQPFTESDLEELQVIYEVFIHCMQKPYALVSFVC